MNNQRVCILGAAVHLARRVGLYSIKRDDVAAEAEVSAGSINYHFQTMAGLRDAVMEYAVKNEVLEIVAHGIMGKHPRALGAPESLQRKAARDLIK